MLFGLMLVFFTITCLLLILVILIQQGKGGLGLGSLGGGAQMLFGGSGGQDIFQKITWVFGAIFMIGSFLLFLVGSKRAEYARYVGKNRANVNYQQASKLAAPKEKLPDSQKLPEQPKK